MHFQDDFNINRYPNFDFKFSNFLDSKTLGNVIVLRARTIAVENLTWSYNGYKYYVNVSNPFFLNTFFNNAGGI